MDLDDFLELLFEAVDIFNRSIATTVVLNPVLEGSPLLQWEALWAFSSHSLVDEVSQILTWRYNALFNA